MESKQILIIYLFVFFCWSAPLVIREQHKGAKQLADFILNNKLPESSKLLIEPRSQDNYKLTLITR